MSNCCESSCQSQAERIPIPARAEVPCPPSPCCQHCLLDLFLVHPAFATLACGTNTDRQYAICLALNQADLYIGGSLESGQKTQATMLIAAHLLKIEQQMALEMSTQLAAIAGGKPTPTSNLLGSSDFWSLTPYGMMYQSIAPANPRFGILGIC